MLIKEVKHFLQDIPSRLRLRVPKLINDDSRLSRVIFVQSIVLVKRRFEFFECNVHSNAGHELLIIAVWWEVEREKRAVFLILSYIPIYVLEKLVLAERTGREE